MMDKASSHVTFCNHSMSTEISPYSKHGGIREGNQWVVMGRITMRMLAIVVNLADRVFPIFIL